MKMLRKSLVFVSFVVFTLLLVQQDARAYVDPNAAGLLYQIFFPIVVAVTIAWRWIKEAFKQLLRQLMSVMTRRKD